MTSCKESFKISDVIESIQRISLESKQSLLDDFNNQLKPKILEFNIRDDQSIIEFFLEKKVDIGQFIMWISRGLADYSYGNKRANSIIEKISLSEPYILDALKYIAKLEYTQNDTWSSKRIIADTLQENIRRYYNNEPLIPIKIVINSEYDKFIPNIEEIKTKGDLRHTPAELRTVYKLMYEIPDDVLKKIMKETTSFYNRTKENTYEKIDSPWDIEKWECRPRGQRSLELEPYSTRSEEKIPMWIKEIIELKKRYSSNELSAKRIFLSR